MKTTKTKTTKTTTSSTIDLFDGLAVPKKSKIKAAEKASEFLLEVIAEDVGKTTSPVSGKKFQRLSKKYKKFKQSKGLPGKPDLVLTKEMMGRGLDAKIGKKGTMELGVFGKAAPRADGHNNLSGKSSLPLRNFLPKEGQEFRKGINKELQKVIQDAVAESFRPPYSRLKLVQSKSEFYEIMRESFGPLSRAKIKRALMDNDEVLTQLASRDLIRFL
jgi:hypothetical protein